jgi:tRNA1(Val) A37 N6-methylase TrmN6
MQLIRQCAGCRTVLDIGTGGLALLAIFAAQAKARKVYAVEANKDAFEQVALMYISLSSFETFA